MQKSKHILKLANRIVKQLKLYAKKIQIVGSIRRNEKTPVDIDIVLIPQDRIKLENYLKTKGQFVQGGEHESTWKIEGVKVELYYTVPDEWGASLLAYSSKKGSGIGLRLVAKRKGLNLNNHGLWKSNKRIAGRTEREIYRALKRPYKEPWER